MNTKLKVLYLNACSIRSKVDEFVVQLEIGRYIVSIPEMCLSGLQLGADFPRLQILSK